MTSYTLAGTKTGLPSPPNFDSSSVDIISIESSESWLKSTKIIVDHSLKINSVYYIPSTATKVIIRI